MVYVMRSAPPSMWSPNAQALDALQQTVEKLEKFGSDLSI